MELSAATDRLLTAHHSTGDLHDAGRQPAKESISQALVVLNTDKGNSLVSRGTRLLVSRLGLITAANQTAATNEAAYIGALDEYNSDTVIRVFEISKDNENSGDPERTALKDDFAVIVFASCATTGPCPRKENISLSVTKTFKHFACCIRAYLNQ